MWNLATEKIFCAGGGVLWRHFLALRIVVHAPIYETQKKIKSLKTTKIARFRH